jgi:hypothetical protein
VIVFGSPNDGAAIATASGSPFNYNPAAGDVVISRRNEDKLLGGAIFYGYTGASIRVHVAGFTPGALSKDLLWVCLHYPFVQLKCQKLLAFIPSGNRKSLELSARLGLKEEARIANVYPDGDLVIRSLKKEDCHWLDRIKPTGIRESA